MENNKKRRWLLTIAIFAVKFQLIAMLVLGMIHHTALWYTSSATLFGFAALLVHIHTLEWDNSYQGFRRRRLKLALASLLLAALFAVIFNYEQATPAYNSFVSGVFKAVLGADVIFSLFIFAMSTLALTMSREEKAPSAAGLGPNIVGA